MTTKDKQQILEWWFLNDNKFGDKNSWRKEFVKMLDGLIDEDGVPTDEVIKELDKNIITVSHKNIDKRVADLKFDWVDSDYKNLKPVNKSGEKEYKLFNFNREISSKDAIKEMKKKGFIPADNADLLAYAKNGWNNKDYVVALGSTWRNAYFSRYVLVLLENDSGRRLDLYDWDGDWDDDYRFLGVRK